MPTPGDAFRRVLACLDRMELPYLVGGSVASSFHGVPRATNDIDMVVALPAADAEEFVKQLGPGFYADPEAIRESIARGRLFNVIDTATTFKIDIHPYRDDAYSLIEFSRRTFVSVTAFGGPIECAMATAEDTILRKLLWGKRGGGISEKQWNDAAGIVGLRRGTLDFAYMRHWASQIGVAALLERLISGAPESQMP